MDEFCQHFLAGAGWPIHKNRNIRGSNTLRQAKEITTCLITRRHGDIVR